MTCINMKVFKYIKMYVQKYLCENIKTESIKICTMCKKCVQKNMLDFLF